MRGERCFSANDGFAFSDLFPEAIQNGFPLSWRSHIDGQTIKQKRMFWNVAKVSARITCLSKKETGMESGRTAHRQGRLWSDERASRRSSRWHITSDRGTVWKWWCPSSRSVRSMRYCLLKHTGLTTMPRRSVPASSRLYDGGHGLRSWTCLRTR